MSIPYLLDTNIFVYGVRADDTWEQIKARYNPMMAPSRPCYSLVTAGELRSLALQFNWQRDKLSQLNFLLDYFDQITIDDEEIIKAYAQVDYFSRSVGNRMGKNDLWIAATAKAKNLTLLTTDRDFDPISPSFIQLEWIDPNSANQTPRE